MAKVLVLYYSSFGHIETMAQAIAEGARSAGATVDVKRVPETLPADVAKASHFKLEQLYPVRALPAAASALLASAPGHCEFSLQLPRYGGGVLSLLSS